MKSGGFDCIVGNPPYVKYENLNSAFLEYAKRSFLSAASFFDIFQIFIEKGISLLKKQGVCGFIFPSLFLKGINYQTTRKILVENASIKLIKELGDGVFEKVKMPTCIMIFERGKTKNNTLFFTDSGNKTLKIKQSDFINDNFLFIKKTFIDKLSNRCISLKDIAEVKRGLEIGKDKIINKRANAVKIIFGQDISRYAIKNLSYVDANISEKFKKSGEVFEGQKLVIRETGDRITAAFDDKSLLTNRSLYCIKTVDFDIKVLLALLNSKLFQYIYEQKFRADTGIFPKIRIGQALSLPIVKEIDKENSEKLKKLVNLMIEIQTKLHLEQNPKDKEIYQNKADILDKKIDAIVYDLYGLTEKEIAVIEKN
jgi:type I restriction-modification system DNA methylase subunit